MHIVIAGNIGSGKSTLTKLLAQHYGWTPRYESVTNNPYLEDYYHDIQRWSFNLEVYFLKERFRDLLAISHAQDVFVANNRAMGNISERDFETYMELFEHMLSIVKLPDLMIYLRSSVEHLVSNIQKRGRDYEQTMQIEYLDNLNRRYEDFINNHYKGRVMIVEKDNLDFENRPEDFVGITNRIDSLLYGLFPMGEALRAD